ncbi:chaperonin 10-like protein, partial [Blyttiomyces helicus]
MQAIQFSETGGVDVLKLTTVPKPVVSPGKILARNYVAGVNFIDTYHRSGLYKVALPYIPGREGAGVVEAIGEGVTKFKVGDRVAYLAPSTYADYALADEFSTVPLPDEATFEEGASLLLQGLTAVSLTKHAYDVKPGDFVLVH